MWNSFFVLHCENSGKDKSVSFAEIRKLTGEANISGETAEEVPVTAPVVATTGLMPQFATRPVNQLIMRNLGITLLFMIRYKILA